MKDRITDNTFLYQISPKRQQFQKVKLLGTPKKNFIASDQFYDMDSLKYCQVKQVISSGIGENKTILHQYYSGCSYIWLVL